MGCSNTHDIFNKEIKCTPPISRIHTITSVSDSNDNKISYLIKYIISLPQVLQVYIKNNPYLINYDDEEYKMLNVKEPIISIEQNFRIQQYKNINNENARVYIFDIKSNELLDFYLKEGKIIKARMICLQNIYDILDIDTCSYKLITNTGNVFESKKDVINNEINGTCYKEDGTIIKAKFKMDKLSSDNEIIVENRFTYKGNINNGFFNGKGTLIGGNGSVYKGEFVNGYYDGHGQFSWKKQGSIQHKYVGDYKNGIKEGKGKYELKSGCAFIGNWENGSINGSCAFEWGFKFTEAFITNDFFEKISPVEEKINEEISTEVQLNADLSDNLKRIKRENIRYFDVLYEIEELYNLCFLQIYLPK